MIESGEMMRREVLRQIPVLDEHGKVIELLLLQELLAPAQLLMLWSCSRWKGTRLRPYTEHC